MELVKGTVARGSPRFYSGLEIGVFGQLVLRTYRYQVNISKLTPRVTQQVYCGVFVQFLGLRGTGAVLPHSPRTTAAMQVPGFRLDFWVLGGGGGKGAQNTAKTMYAIQI